MKGKKLALNLLLSPLYLVLVVGSTSVSAKEVTKAKNKQKIASVSIKLPDTVEKANPKSSAKKKYSNKAKTTNKAPVSMNHKDLATLSDDEVTRIKLIKRYEGVENPRTDWAHGLRTLNWHYTDSINE